MIKVTVEKRHVEEQITIDLYIPIDVKWNEAEESTRYCRFGDFKQSILEVGVDSKKRSNSLYYSCRSEGNPIE